MRVLKNPYFLSVLLIIAFWVALLMLDIPAVEAANPLNTNPFSEFGGSQSIEAAGKKMQDNLLSIVGVIRVIGAAIALGSLVWAGILFATSGNNPQRRAGAIACFGGVIVGIIIIANAGVIGGWIGSMTFR